MTEIAAIAQAYGYHDVNRQYIDICIGRVKTRRPPGVEPSMMADALAGRNMEVEAIVGNVVRLAQDKKVNVPILRTIYALLQALDNSFTRNRQAVA